MSRAVRKEEAAGGRRILIVEDEILLARDTSYMLRDMGCIVVGIAATAEEAVSQAGTFHPDLVLMDIRLKGLRDGIDAAEEIHHLFGLSVVFVTAQSDEAILDRAKATHPAAFLFKPFAEEDLFRTLRNVGLPAAAPSC
jgi:two-component system, response regulator PdtaR